MEMTMIRPGDASMAAPFTSRAPSIRSCVTLVRQGRCTLLSALQQQQIMVCRRLAFFMVRPPPWPSDLTSAATGRCWSV
jgi:hypothetical protein